MHEKSRGCSLQVAVEFYFIHGQTNKTAIHLKKEENPQVLTETI